MLLTPYITSCFEDEQQYEQNRGMEDTVITLLDTLTNNLDEDAENYSRVVFIDFSGAFNTIDPLRSIIVMAVIIQWDLWRRVYRWSQGGYITSKMPSTPKESRDVEE